MSNKNLFCHNPLMMIGLGLLLTLTIKSNAQNYQISFSGVGAATTVESVKIENITQGTKLSLLGTDVLNLMITTGIKDQIIKSDMVVINPTPMQGRAELLFYTKQSGNTQIVIFDISGKKVIQTNDKLQQGINKYEITGIKEGSYIVNIIGGSYQYNVKLISENNQLNNNARIEYLGKAKSGFFPNTLKNTRSTVNMDYKTGDNLRFTGYSGIYTNILNDKPTASKTITFTFAILPLVTTDPISLITNKTATGGGNVTSDGWSTVTLRGICFAKTHNPTTSNSVISVGSGTGIFIANMIGLTGNTTYYVRAYAVNNIGTSYGNEKSFTTLADPVLPMLTTLSVSKITHNTATSGGFISNDGGAKVTDRGVCWSISQNPLITSNHSNDGSDTGVFISNITSLIADTIYYVRAYAINSVGTAYGNQISFRTLKAPTLPQITIDYIDQKLQKSAHCGATLISDGGSPVTARGICWCNGCSNPPDTTNAHTIDTSSTNSFVNVMTGLTANRTYAVRAYATNSMGTAYSSIKYFTTLTNRLPNNMGIITVCNAGLNKATCTSDVINDGGLPITARGVCWSTSPSPVFTGNHTTDSTDTGTFTSNITGLTLNTLYYFRVYATNSMGTAYGSDFYYMVPSINPCLPTINTNGGIHEKTQNTATINLQAICDGNSPITALGVCWSHSSTSPVVSDSHSVSGTGLGNFLCVMTGLTPNTKYYFRIYATNIVGTVYGNPYDVTTRKAYTLPTVITQSFVCNTSQTITSVGGDITDSGGTTITDRGICWSTSHNPVISGNHTSDGIGSGTFTSNISGLKIDTIYYIRAYATNSVGTAYGNEVTYTATQKPNLITYTISKIGQTTATSGGNIICDGGLTITARGVCWSTSQNPDLSGSHTTDGTGIGSFTSNITGLTLNTTYYIRSYATNSAGTSYGDTVSFNTFGTLSIGQSYQGGVIIYIFQPGDPGYISGQQHGLIVPTTDQSSGIQWYNGSYISISTGSSLGSGNSNTSSIVSYQGTGSYAARLCYDLSLGGYSDWYLPSKDELNKFCIYSNGVSKSYWSSTQYSQNEAYYQYFLNSNQYPDDKSTSYKVRAMRSF